ncbi:MAG: hypothetical protein LBM16_00960, partial [Clostridiales bacterium]|nr:hypothetical protein [Clostridiales bacterium]
MRKKLALFMAFVMTLATWVSVPVEVTRADETTYTYTVYLYKDAASNIENIDANWTGRWLGTPEGATLVSTDEYFDSDATSPIHMAAAGNKDASTEWKKVVFTTTTSSADVQVFYNETGWENVPWALQTGTKTLTIPAGDTSGVFYIYDVDMGLRKNTPPLVETSYPEDERDYTYNVYFNVGENFTDPENWYLKVFNNGDSQTGFVKTNGNFIDSDIADIPNRRAFEACDAEEATAGWWKMTFTLNSPTTGFLCARTYDSSAYNAQTGDGTLTIPEGNEIGNFYFTYDESHVAFVPATTPPEDFAPAATPYPAEDDREYTYNVYFKRDASFDDPENWYLRVFGNGDLQEGFVQYDGSFSDDTSNRRAFTDL